MSRRVSIKSLACLLPRRRVRNDEAPYSTIPNVPEGWWDLWGANYRGILAPDQGESVDELGARVAGEALDLAGLAPGDIDLVLANVSVVGIRESSGAARLAPRLSSVVRDRIGARGAIAFDVEQECMSFLLAWQIAVNFIREGRYRRVLLVSVEHSTSVLDFTESTATIFGDGASAAILTDDQEGGAEFLSSAYASNSREFDLATLVWRYPVARPVEKRRPEDYWSYFTLREDTPDRMQLFIPVAVPSVVNAALSRVGMTPDDVDFFVFHQPSKLLVGLWAMALGAGEDRTMTTMQHYGCLISVSMAITLRDAIASGKIGPGKKVVVAGAATGWGFGAHVWTWGETKIRAQDVARDRAICGQP